MFAVQELLYSLLFIARLDRERQTVFSYYFQMFLRFFRSVIHTFQSLKDMYLKVAYIFNVMCVEVMLVRPNFLSHSA